MHAVVVLLAACCGFTRAACRSCYACSQLAWDLVALPGDGCYPASKPFSIKPEPTASVLQHSGSMWDFSAVGAGSEGGALLPSPNAMVPELRTLRTSLSEDGAIGLSRRGVPAAASHLDLPTLDAISDTEQDVPGCRMDISRQASASLLTDQAPHQPTTLDLTLSALWDDCDARGLFRYSVADTRTRVVPGRWGWVAQLNEGRSSKKRATELRLDAVCQPFDAAKFHFGKAFTREVLLQFEPLLSNTAAVESGAATPLGWAANKEGARMVESAALASDPTVVRVCVGALGCVGWYSIAPVPTHQPAQHPYAVKSLTYRKQHTNVFV